MPPAARKRQRSPGLVLLGLASRRGGLVMVPVYSNVSLPLFPIIRSAATRLAGGLARKVRQVERVETVLGAAPFGFCAADINVPHRLTGNCGYCTENCVGR